MQKVIILPDWSETASGLILASLDVPVLGVFVDGTRPSSGPLTSAVLLSRYVEALTRHYGS